MKKTLILSAFALLTACTTHTQEVYRGYDDQGCNYYDENGNCLSRRYATQTYYTQNGQPIRVVKARRPVVVANTYTYQDTYQTPKGKTNTTLLPSSPCSNYNGSILESEPCNASKAKPAPQPVAEPILVNTAPVQRVVKVVPNVVPCANTVATSSGCQSTVKEVKEPVEITYKKTTYTTVYKPETHEAVSYEKQPVTGAQVVSTRVIAQPTNVVETTTATTAPVVVTTTTPTKTTVVTQPVNLAETTPAIVENEIIMPEEEIK